MWAVTFTTLLVSKSAAAFSWRDVNYIYKHLVNIQNLHAEILPLPKLSEKYEKNVFCGIFCSLHWISGFPVRCLCMLQDTVALWPEYVKHLFYIFSLLSVWTCLLSLTSHKARSHYGIYFLIIELVRMLFSSVVGQVWIGEVMHK